MSEITKSSLLSELHLVIGGAYCSYKLSEEAWNFWLKMFLNQEEESK